MDKQHILDEIRRTAAANEGVPLGRARFLAETGIKEVDWRGRFWARWADAVVEAGFAPNQLNTKFEDSSLLAHVAALTKKLGRYPTNAEMRLERRSNPSIPSSGAIERLGSKDEILTLLRQLASQMPDLVEVLDLLAPPTPQRSDSEKALPGESNDGYVYLIQSGRYYKIGRTNALGRREREITLQLPEKAATLHVIRMDDPVGIEAYWHRRFESLRRNGEWFELSRADVHAFKRRKFM